MTYVGWYHLKGYVQRIPKMHLARVKACVLEGLFFSDEIFDRYEWRNWAFRNLNEDNNFPDVTLACEDGQQMKAHKVILAGQSQLAVFKLLTFVYIHLSLFQSLDSCFMLSICCCFKLPMSSASFHIPLFKAANIYFCLLTRAHPSIHPVFDEASFEYCFLKMCWNCALKLGLNKLVGGGNPIYRLELSFRQCWG